MTAGYAGPVRRMSALFGRNVLVARRTWPVIVSGFFEPVFYLLALGVGLGSALGTVRLDGGLDVPYVAFVAPALMAVSAMNGALYDTTINVLWKLRYQKFYATIAVTPIGAADVVVGEVVWAQVRGALYSSAFLLTTVLVGAVRSAWALLAVPAALLVGVAFGAVGMAAATFMRGWQDLELATVTQLALFLFSGTFFPVSVYPAPVRFVVELSPLHHAVELVRGLTLGTLAPGLAGHVAYLVVMAAVGFAVAARRFDRFLVQ